MAARASIIATLTGRRCAGRSMIRLGGGVAPLAGADAELPPYGLWRRVDDALFDALACWPPTDRRGRSRRASFPGAAG